MKGNFMLCQNEMITLPLNSLENKIVNEPNDSTTVTRTKSENKTLSGITKTSGVYKIVNKTNNKYYVGSSKDIKVRIIRHIRRLNNNCHSNHHLQSAWNLYGKDNFEFIIVEKSEQSLITEQKYLDIAKMEQDKCYNMRFFVDKMEMTDEIRKRISDGVKKKLISDPNVRKRLSESHKGKKLSERSKSILSELSKGKLNVNYGIPISVRMNGKNDRTGKPNRNKTVFRFRNTNTDEVFEGIRFEFQNKISVSPTSISFLINGKRSLVKGWELVQ
jgi:group I intron endonuclease